MTAKEIVLDQSPENKYAKNGLFWHGFSFPNSETKSRSCLDSAFRSHGMVIASVDYEMISMLTWVLTEDGNLWLHDKSHGGGGGFSLESRAK